MKQLAQKLLLLLVSIVLGLAAAEWVLHAKNLPRFYKSHSTPGQFDFTITDDGQLRYTNLPSTEITFVYDGHPIDYAVSHKTNSYGFRGKEFRSTKPSHWRRIAFLGDSFTFGEGVRDDRTFSERTSRLLNELAGEDRSIRFESFNFGVGGFNTNQTCQLLEETALQWNPDIVVLALTLNDAEPDLFYYNREKGETERREREDHIAEGISDPRPPDSFFYRFRLTKLIWQLLRARETTARTVDYYRSLYAEGSEGWESARTALHRIIRLCDERGIECYVLCFPIFFQLTDRYPFAEIHRLIADEVNSAGSASTHFLDLFPLYKGMKDSDLWVHPTDQHPNELAHETLARFLSETIYKTCVKNEPIQVDGQN